MGLNFSSADIVEGLKEELRTRIAGAGYDQISLLRFHRRRLLEIAWSEAANVSKSAADRYRDTEAVPIALLVIDNPGPVFWRALASTGQAHALNASELGFHDGLSFAVHGPRCVCDVLHISRSFSRPDSIDEEISWELYSAGCIACARLQRLQPVEGMRMPRTILTERESAVIGWCKEGKSYSEIGVILGISSKTVEFHVSNVMRKLGVSHKVAAIIDAIKLGIIEL